MTKSIPDIDVDAALQRLEAVRSKRGYLLAHHGLLSLTAPDLLTAYDACYTELTLKERTLKAFEKEFIWLGILAIKEEHLATQHVDKFKAAGGTDAQVVLALRLAAIAPGIASFAFGEAHWRGRIPDLDAKQLHLDAIDALRAGTDVSDELIQMACTSIQTSRRGWPALRWHIEECYRLGVPEPHLAEALSYSMFTGSIPNFIEGCDVWRAMIKAGEVDASEPFKLWAEIDQDGP